MAVNRQPYNAVNHQAVVILPLQGEVIVRMAFEDFAGRFVYHCHILNHEDNGMMAVVNVVEE